MGLLTSVALVLVAASAGRCLPSEGSRRPIRNGTWTADNGNGTYSNPLFFDEFSDPDLIRVGDDYYLTGTTMHSMPGLPVLHSRDLVNWEFLSYAAPRLDYGPQYRLEGGQSIYGQGIWAPCLRYRDGTFYIFSNVNGRATQVYSATNPRGPWAHREMKQGFHDLSVLFDSDGKAYVVWGYRDLHIAQLNDALDDVVPGTEHAPFGKDALIGEGSHFYKIDGKYIIVSAWYAGGFRMPCARADTPFGPYEVNPAISKDESFGLTAGYRLKNDRNGSFETRPLNPDGGPEWASIHQGGIVHTQKGEWWGFSMMDANSVGRLTCLSPITWQDGWPYFGLPGNLGRTPRTWVKPDTGFKGAPTAPYNRSDDFNGRQLSAVWQWNHAPVDDKWSLTERKGHLRLHTLPGEELLSARNTLTQRAIGPESAPTVELDAGGLKKGDVAGLALVNYPYAWIGVRLGLLGPEIAEFDQITGKTFSLSLPTRRVWLRAQCDFLIEMATLSYSLDGSRFQQLGPEFKMIFQLRTFQGVRFGLFAYGSGGGWADFTKFTVHEPHPKMLSRTIPVGATARFAVMGEHLVLAAEGDHLVGESGAVGIASNLKILDRGLGRIALQSADGRFVTVPSPGEDKRVRLDLPLAGDSQTFQWTEMPRGDILLLSLTTHQYLRVHADGSVRADAPGAQFNRKNGASLICLLM